MNKALITLVLALLIGTAGYFGLYQQQSALSGLQVMPPKPLTPMILMDYERNSLGIDVLKDKWTYIVFADNDCADVCNEQLRVVEQAVAASSQPIQPLLVMGFEPSAELIDAIKQQHPDLTIAVLTRSIWSIFTVQFLSVLEQLSGQAIIMTGPFGMIRLAYDELASADQLIADQPLIFAKVK